MVNSKGGGTPGGLRQVVLGWALLCVVLVSVIPLGANRPISWTILGLAVLLLFLLQALLDLRGRAPVARARAVPVAALYVAVVLWAIVQVMVEVPLAYAHPVWSLVPADAVRPRISADPDTGLHVILRLTTYGMVAWMAVAVALDSKQAWRLVKAFAIFSTLLAGFGLTATFTNVNPVLGEDLHQGYVSATFRNRNSYATYAAFGLLANLAAYRHQEKDTIAGGDFWASLRNGLESFFGGSWIYLLGILLCGAAIALTQSRAGAGVTVIGVLVFLAVLSRRGSRHAGRSGLVLWGGLVVMLGFVAVSLGSGTLERFLDPRVEDRRFDIFEQIIAQIQERPLLGHGAGGFEDAFRPFVPLEAAGVEWNYAHSSYLENLHEFGLPMGAVLYLCLALILWRLFQGVRQRPTSRELPAFALACGVVGAVHATVDFSLQMPASAAMFALILGIGWAQSYPREARSLPRTEHR